MNRAHLLACINAAQLAGFTHYAAALLALYRRELDYVGQSEHSRCWSPAEINLDYRTDSH